MFKKIGKKSFATIFCTSVLSANAFAAGESAWDYSTLTSGIDTTTVTIGILAVAAIMAGLFAGVRLAKLVLSFIRS